MQKKSKKELLKNLKDTVENTKVMDQYDQAQDLDGGMSSWSYGMGPVTTANTGTLDDGLAVSFDVNDNLYQQSFDFDDEKLRITERTKATDIEEWDSLNQIKLIISCEKEFSVQLKPREINNLQNVGQMLDHLTEKLSTKNS